MKLGIKKISETEQRNILLPFVNESEPVKLPDSIVWNEIPVVNVSGTLEETTEHNENGKLRSVTVNATVVDKSALVREQLRGLESGHVFKVEDMNGVEYLVGTNSFRSVMTYRHEINQLGKNSFEIEISHQSPYGALRIFHKAVKTGYFVSLYDFYPVTDFTGLENDVYPKVSLPVASYLNESMIFEEIVEIENVEVPEWIHSVEIVYLQAIDVLVAYGIRFNVMVYLYAFPNYGAYRSGTVNIRQKDTGNVISIEYFQNTTPVPESRIGFVYDNAYSNTRNLSVHGGSYSIDMQSLYNQSEGHPFGFSGVPEWLSVVINVQYNKIYLEFSAIDIERRDCIVVFTQQDSGLQAQLSVTQLE
ncbi:MAG: hypothetical protein LBC19_00545 [Tannerella sp.]|jgi:hypothetical protein|nr:hypothetical protein [Tannerella sp.]